jgi:hypothetical protein
MAKSQKKCLPVEILERAIQHAKKAGDNEVVQFLNNIKTCRKPSKYNEFIGKCMKSGKNMSDCAAEYRKSK